MSQHPSTVVVVGGFAASLINFRGELLRAMRTGGHEVCAVAPALTDDAPTVARLRQLGIAIADVPFERAGLNPASDFRALRSLVELFQRLRPTHVLTYTAKPVIWGMIAARIAGVRYRYAMITGLGYAFTGQATGARRMIQWIVRALYAFALRGADKVFFQNPDDEAQFRRLNLIGTATPSIITNGSGVDTEHFSAVALPPGPIRFLMIARLLGDKGVREFAAAAAIVRGRHSEVEFHLVGGSDVNPDALPVDVVRQWHDSGILQWHGATDDVRPFLARCHIFVLPSYREGTPRTVLEAMATGRAIITTDAPGCRQTVEEGWNGVLVPPRDAEALAGAMQRLIENESLVASMGMRSRERAVQKYDVHAVNMVLLKEMGLSG